MNNSPNLSSFRRRWLTLLAIAAIILLAVMGWNAYHRLGEPGWTSQPTTTMMATGELPVQLIDLEGPASKAEAEISGMAWYGDWLILLPQYPDRFEGQVFALSRQEITAYLDNTDEGALTPRSIPLETDGLEKSVLGFEGFEAVGFDGNHVYMTIEANQTGKMHGYIVQGEISNGEPPAGIRLNSASLQEIPLPAALSNYSDESLVVFQHQVFTFYEANGANVNPHPMAHIFGEDLIPLGTVSFPNIEYRITDATSADTNGFFWAINYLFPGDLGKLRPAVDPLSDSPDTQPSGPVERLVAFRITQEGIILDASQPMLKLELLKDGEARNWEGIVRLDDRGFLLATDRYPGTLLGFVPLPAP